MRKFAGLLCLCVCAAALSGCFEELDWREWRAPDASFSVLLPAKPKEESRTLAIGAQSLNLRMVSSSFDGLAFGIGYADIPANTPAALLTDARDALVKNILGSLTNEEKVEIAGAHGLEFRARGTPGGTPMALAARVLRDEGRFYQVLVVGRQDRVNDADADLFLRSFKPLR